VLRDLQDNVLIVTDGPFIELKELMGGFAVLEVNSLDEAIEWSKRFLQIIGEGESEWGPSSPFVQESLFSIRIVSLRGLGSLSGSNPSICIS
jgi:hypothetical protein